MAVHGEGRGVGKQRAVRIYGVEAGSEAVRGEREVENFRLDVLDFAWSSSTSRTFDAKRTHLSSARPQIGIGGIVDERSVKTTSPMSALPPETVRI
jgi:hypothetical protein